LLGDTVTTEIVDVVAKVIVVLGGTTRAEEVSEAVTIDPRAFVVVTPIKI